MTASVQRDIMRRPRTARYSSACSRYRPSGTTNVCGFPPVGRSKDVKTNKNYAADAEAICEAVWRLPLHRPDYCGRAKLVSMVAGTRI